MISPRLPFYWPSFSLSRVRHVKGVAIGIVASAGIILNALVSSLGLNALVSSLGITNWNTESRWWLNIVSIAIITMTAIAMIASDEKHSPSPAQIAIVTVVGTTWIVARNAMTIATLDEWLGNPIANAPLETALMVFAGSRLFRWPDSWIAFLAICSYSLYVFLPSSITPRIRDVPVTFSFVLFACLTVDWWVKSWTRRPETPSTTV